MHIKDHIILKYYDKIKWSVNNNSFWGGLPYLECKIMSHWAYLTVNHLPSCMYYRSIPIRRKQWSKSVVNNSYCHHHRARQTHQNELFIMRRIHAMNLVRTCSACILGASFYGLISWNFQTEEEPLIGTSAATGIMPVNKS